MLISTSASEWKKLDDDDEVAMMDKSLTTTKTKTKTTTSTLTPTTSDYFGSGSSKTKPNVKDDDRNQHEDIFLPVLPPPSGKNKNHTTTTTPGMVEIQGLSLLEDRDDSLREIKQANQAMFFHALQLIKRQKHWLSMLRDDDSTSIEQRRKALHDLEIRITDAASNERSMTSTFAGQKALFKAMALLDDSMATFERRYKPTLDKIDDDDDNDESGGGGDGGDDDSEDYDIDHNIQDDLLSYDCSLFTSSETLLKQIHAPGETGGLTIIKEKEEMRDIPSLLGGHPFAADADSWANEVEKRMMMCSGNGDYEDDFTIGEDLTLARIEI